MNSGLKISKTVAIIMCTMLISNCTKETSNREKLAQKIKTIVLIGGPGAGKGTIAKMIVEKYGCYHMSTGDLLRKEVADQTKIGLEIKETISKGNLVTDKVMQKVIANGVDSNPGAKCLILDGYPRRLDSAKGLYKMADALNLDIAHIINLKVKDETVIKRLLKRATIEGRADDNLTSIKNRISIYHKNTNPILEILGDKVISIDGDDGSDKVWEKIDQVLKK